MESPPRLAVLGSTVVALPARMRGALRLLLQAHRYAQELACDSWDFAVEIEGLRAEGLSNSDLRWLICKSCVEHAVETTPAGRDARSFRVTGKLWFHERTCVVLTPVGVQSTLRLLSDPADACRRPPQPRSDPGEALLPHWIRGLRELRVGLEVVKHFKQPAPNQELILSAFEEEGWPDVIDDPLPPRANQDPKRHLHDTINNLNRHQKHPLLHFSGDGHGRGVRWRFLRSRTRRLPQATPELL